MIKTFDHIGIAVRNVDQAVRVFQEVFGAEPAFRREAPELGSITAAVIFGGKQVSLNQPVDDKGPIGKFLARRGEGFEHLAVEVDDVEAVVARLESHGIPVLKKDFESEFRHEALVHPKHFFGVLLQLVEWRGECKHSIEARLRLGGEKN